MSNASDLGPCDVPHLGIFFKRVRNGHDVTLQALADQASISSPSTISEFEKTGNVEPENFEQYVYAFQQEDTVPSHQQPLSEAQADLLIRLYDAYKGGKGRKELIRRRFCNLANVNFQSVTSKRRLKVSALDELLSELESIGQPALLTDDLWFVHAVNGAVMRLFGVTPGHDMLYQWEGWHSIAVKLLDNSPVKHNHANVDSFFPHTEAFFFQSPHTLPLLFSPQMRYLLQELCNISRQHNHKFHRWMLGIISLTAPLETVEESMLPRTIRYQGKKIQLYPRIVRRVEVALEKGPGHFSLATWDTDDNDTDANEVFEDIRRSPGSDKIYYAAEYDQNREFHVNDWPDVATDIIELGCL